MPFGAVVIAFFVICFLLSLRYDTVGETGTGDRAMRVLRSGGFYVTITGALATTVKPGVTQNMFINSNTNLANADLLDALRDLMKDGKEEGKREANSWWTCVGFTDDSYI